MGDPKHPLITTYCFDAPANLVGQRLDTMLVVGFRKCAAIGMIGSMLFLIVQKQIDRLAKPTREDVFIGLVRQKPRLGFREILGQPVAIDRRD
jgi:hypothetical protein